jgi:ribosome-associated protein
LAERGKRSDAARQLAVAAARTALDNKAEDILVLNLKGFSPITDYFVICTGTSDRQMRAVADEICGAGRRMGQPVWHTEGMEAADWILLDFVDVVVHIFDLSHRRYYDLELIWGEAPHVRWRPRRSTSHGRREKR